MSKFVKIYLDDDFEPGCCSDCPLAYYDQDHLGDYYCALQYGYWECPLEIEEDEKI